VAPYDVVVAEAGPGAHGNPGRRGLVFLDKLVAALGRAGQLDRPELRDVRFSRTRMRPGYVITDVDAFLEEVAQATW